MEPIPMPAAAPQDTPEDLIVFDGTCVFCSGFAQFMTRHDTARRFRFVTAHSPTGQDLYRRYDLDPEEMETNIVIVAGKAYTHMHAFAAAMRARLAMEGRRRAGPAAGCNLQTGLPLHRAQPLPFRPPRLPHAFARTEGPPD
jgi:hypothetical protein